MNRIVLLAVLGVILIVGCNKKPKDTSLDTPPPAGGSGGISVGLGGSVQNGSGGPLTGAMQAARRTQALNELMNLGVMIEEIRDPSGRMPTKEQILAELKKSAPTILKGIEEGSYILTGTTDGSGLWAYEVDADKQPGVALIGGRATRSSPDEVKRYLGMK
jgi:hypothetical protein